MFTFNLQLFAKYAPDCLHCSRILSTPAFYLSVLITSVYLYNANSSVQYFNSHSLCH